MACIYLSTKYSCRARALVASPFASSLFVSYFVFLFFLILLAEQAREEADNAAAGLLLAAGERVLDVRGSLLLDELGGTADGLIERVVLGLVRLLDVGEANLLGGGGSLGLGGGVLLVTSPFLAYLYSTYFLLTFFK